MPPSRRARAAYPLLLALGTLDATGYSVIVPVAPAIADATGAGPAPVGLLVASFQTARRRAGRKACSPMILADELPAQHAATVREMSVSWSLGSGCSRARRRTVRSGRRGHRGPRLPQIPEIYNASPIARYKVAGLPLITVAAVGFLALLVFCLVKWLTDDVYALNDTGSLIYMGALYVLALAIYVASRVVRKRQGIDMAMVHKEIPAE